MCCLDNINNAFDQQTKALDGTFHDQYYLYSFIAQVMINICNNNLVRNLSVIIVSRTLDYIDRFTTARCHDGNSGGFRRSYKDVHAFAKPVFYRFLVACYSYKLS